MKRRTAAEHALVRDLSIYTPRGRLLGDSRRQARLDHRTHRLVVAEEARRRRTGLAAFAEKAGAL
jgi:hypothetical protein